ncbi:MAG: DinB family protein [Chitinophagaceae bacterium]|nr:DinB family protein [Chitinophagaceae bacterium]
MNLPALLAKHIKEVFFGKNWTWVNLKDTLDGVTWQQAITKVHSFNTIAALVYHINYYVRAVTKVLEGGVLDSKDKYSFDHPPINNQQDWETFMNEVWNDVEKFVVLVEQLPDDKLTEIFADEKYGSYYRNIQGVIEHTHYHLGQIVLIKKILFEENPVL